MIGKIGWSFLVGFIFGAIVFSIISPVEDRPLEPNNSGVIGYDGTYLWGYDSLGYRFCIQRGNSQFLQDIITLQQQRENEKQINNIQNPTK